MGIHKYHYKDKYILLDINSSAVFEIDNLIYDLLDIYPEQCQGNVINLLKNKYSQKAIREGISEIDELICTGKLFANQTPVDLINIKNNSVKAMCLHVSHDCNLACMYCFASGGDFNTHKKELMSLEVAKASVDYLIKVSKDRVNLEIDFFGGEPLMNFDVVKKTVEYAESLEEKYHKNFRFTITTNGMQLDDEVMEFVNVHMKNIVISLDGRKEINDLSRPTINGKSSYDIIKSKIISAANTRGKKDYFIRGTFTSLNLDFAEDVKHIADLGIKNISVEPVVADPEKEYAIKAEHLPAIFSEYDKLTDLYLKYKNTSKQFNFFHFNIDLNNSTCAYKKASGCGAGCDYIAVTPQGDIYPCHQFVGQNEFELGNVFKGVENNAVVDSFKEANIFNKVECQSCWAKYFCGGGCHANAYNFSKDLMSTYPTGCEMHKKRVECALYIKSIEKSL